MSLDFFNQGIQGDSGIQYSKQQKQFFESKLMLLDPQKTGQIQLGKILWILSASNLRPDGRQKIMKNCKIQSGKKIFTYDEIRKVFRAIALLQNDIEPSTININANIRTKNPVFYDEDDSEDEEPPPRQAPSQPAPHRQQPQPQAQPAAKKQDFFQKPTQDAPRNLPSRTSSNNVDMFANFEPKKQTPKQIPSKPIQPAPVHSEREKEKESPLTIKLRQFQVRWSKLKTQNNKIEGGQVKTLCKNLSQRTNLAKAWKLCCHTHSKALTKGQFFVFLQIVASPNIPDHLTPEMKNCIALIDRSNPSLPARKQSTVVPSPSNSTKMVSSHIFQNFGKSEVSAYEPPQPKVIKKEQKPDPHTIERFNNLKSNVQELSRHQQQISEEAGVLRRNQETMNNALGQLQQYLTKAKNHTAHFNTQFTQLKENQNVLNERLNKSCFFLSEIIKAQNQMIQNLANDYAQQNHIAQQRVSGLQKYIAELTQALQQKDVIIKQLTGRAQNNPQPAPPRQEPPSESSPQPRSSRQQPERPQPQNQPSRSSQEAPRQPSSRQEAPERPEEQHRQQPQKQQVHSPQPNSPVQEQKQQVSASEQVEHEQRIRSLQSQVFQLLRYIREIVPGDEPKLVEYIKQLSEEQLNEVYIKCYQEFQARQKQEQMEAEMAKARQSAQEDEFASSNFNVQSAPTQDMFD